MTSPSAPSPLDTEELGVAAFRGQTLVLGFAASWEGACPRTLRRIRAELRGLGAALFLISPTALYVFRADDDLEAQLEVDESRRAALERLMRTHRVDPAALARGATTLVIVDGMGARRWSETSHSLQNPWMRCSKPFHWRRFVCMEGKARS